MKEHVFTLETRANFEECVEVIAKFCVLKARLDYQSPAGTVSKLIFLDDGELPIQLVWPVPSSFPQYLWRLIFLHQELKSSLRITLYKKPTVKDTCLLLNYIIWDMLR